MAQNITLMGASYADVPAVVLPKTGGGTARFDDTTDADATAADILTGKTAYVNGEKLVGTGSGGGGGAVKMGVLRPDAELVERWTMDSYVEADLGLTIPSYTTTATTLRASEIIATHTGDPLNYRYYITERMLTTPEYSITTLAKGRQEYVLTAAAYEWIYNPAGQQQTMINPEKAYGVYSQMIGLAMTREVYWSSATAVGVYTSGAYCANQGVTAPTIASNKTITVKSPTIVIRGHATYLTQTFFDAITDIRCQYVIELWRVPLTGVDGWAHGTQMDSIFNDIANNGGTLT